LTTNQNAWAQFTMGRPQLSPVSLEPKVTKKSILTNESSVLSLKYIL